MLLNDGLVMVTERDEFVYHDMIAHVPLFVHPNPKNVLIIGGGDGGTAREVLRHTGIQKCTMVEIDEMVVEACRKFIPQTSKDFDHPKMNLVIGDGFEFVKKTKKNLTLFLSIPRTPLDRLNLFLEKVFIRIYLLLNMMMGLSLAKEKVDSMKSKCKKTYEYFKRPFSHFSTL